MTKLHFNRAAEIVRAILDGEWTNQLPDWAIMNDQFLLDNVAVPAEADHLRAVQTAEAFILMFQQFNSRFDETRFLQACGLVEVAKGRKS